MMRNFRKILETPLSTIILLVVFACSICYGYFTFNSSIEQHKQKIRLTKQKLGQSTRVQKLCYKYLEESRNKLNIIKKLNAELTMKLTEKDTNIKRLESEQQRHIKLLEAEQERQIRLLDSQKDEQIKLLTSQQSSQLKLLENKQEREFKMVQSQKQICFLENYKKQRTLIQLKDILNAQNDVNKETEISDSDYEALKKMIETLVAEKAACKGLKTEKDNVDQKLKSQQEESKRVLEENKRLNDALLGTKKLHADLEEQHAALQKAHGDRAILQRKVERPSNNVQTIDHNIGAVSHGSKNPLFQRENFGNRNDIKSVRKDFQNPYGGNKDNLVNDANRNNKIPTSGAMHVVTNFASIATKTGNLLNNNMNENLRGAQTTSNTVVNNNIASNDTNTSSSNTSYKNTNSLPITTTNTTSNVANNLSNVTLNNIGRRDNMVQVNNTDNGNSPTIATKTGTSTTTLSALELSKRLGLGAPASSPPASNPSTERQTTGSPQFDDADFS